jgi:hypothetical protein
MNSKPWALSSHHPGVFRLRTAREYPLYPVENCIGSFFLESHEVDSFAIIRACYPECHRINSEPAVIYLKGQSSPVTYGQNPFEVTAVQRSWQPGFPVQ